MKTLKICKIKEFLNGFTQKPDRAFKTGILFIFLFIISSCELHKKKEVKYRVWNNYLNWEDFRNVENIDNGISAQIFTGIHCPKIITEKNSMIFAYIDLDKSIKLESIIDSTNYLLNHEKYHFDITEIYARKLRKSILDIGEENLTSYRIESVYKFLEIERSNFQKKYDSISEHSLNRGGQIYMEKYIDSILFSLSDYSKKNILEYESW